MVTAEFYLCTPGNRKSALVRRLTQGTAEKGRRYDGTRPLGQERAQECEEGSPVLSNPAEFAMAGRCTHREDAVCTQVPAEVCSQIQLIRRQTQEIDIINKGF